MEMEVKMKINNDMNIIIDDQRQVSVKYEQSEWEENEVHLKQKGLNFIWKEVYISEKKVKWNVKKITTKQILIEEVQFI